jgi:hypothetical protein
LFIAQRDNTSVDEMGCELVATVKKHLQTLQSSISVQVDLQEQLATTREERATFLTQFEASQALISDLRDQLKCRNMEYQQSQQILNETRAQLPTVLAAQKEDMEVTKDLQATRTRLLIVELEIGASKAEVKSKTENLISVESRLREAESKLRAAELEIANCQQQKILDLQQRRHEEQALHDRISEQYENLSMEKDNDHRVAISLEMEKRKTAEKETSELKAENMTKEAFIQELQALKEEFLKRDDTRSKRVGELEAEFYPLHESAPLTRSFFEEHEKRIAIVEARINSLRDFENNHNDVVKQIKKLQKRACVPVGDNREIQAKDILSSIRLSKILLTEFGLLKFGQSLDAWEKDCSEKSTEILRASADRQNFVSGTEKIHKGMKSLEKDMMHNSSQTPKSQHSRGSDESTSAINLPTHNKIAEVSSYFQNSEESVTPHGRLRSFSEIESSLPPSSSLTDLEEVFTEGSDIPDNAMDLLEDERKSKVFKDSKVMDTRQVAEVALQVIAEAPSIKLYNSNHRSRSHPKSILKPSNSRSSTYRVNNTRISAGETTDTTVDIYSISGGNKSVIPRSLQHGHSSYNRVAGIRSKPPNEVETHRNHQANASTASTNHSTTSNRKTLVVNRRVA